MKRVYENVAAGEVEFMDVSSEEMRGRVFETNVSRLGMLGDSIATDVIIMMTRTHASDY
jgi:hypothetical protein